jgi:hypothetical protein
VLTEELVALSAEVPDGIIDYRWFNLGMAPLADLELRFPAGTSVVPDHHHKVHPCHTFGFLERRSLSDAAHRSLYQRTTHRIRS